VTAPIGYDVGQHEQWPTFAHDISDENLEALLELYGEAGLGPVDQGFQTPSFWTGNLLTEAGDDFWSDPYWMQLDDAGVPQRLYALLAGAELDPGWATNPITGVPMPAAELPTFLQGLESGESVGPEADNMLANLGGLSDYFWQNYLGGHGSGHDPGPWELANDLVIDGGLGASPWNIDPDQVHGGYGDFDFSMPNITTGDRLDTPSPDTGGALLNDEILPSQQFMLQNQYAFAEMPEEHRIEGGPAGVYMQQSAFPAVNAEILRYFQNPYTTQLSTIDGETTYTETPWESYSAGTAQEQYSAMAGAIDSFTGYAGYDSYNNTLPGLFDPSDAWQPLAWNFTLGEAEGGEFIPDQVDEYITEATPGSPGLRDYYGTAAQTLPRDLSGRLITPRRKDIPKSPGRRSTKRASGDLLEEYFGASLLGGRGNR
jgi:hypothetical protein